jgi:hypothetical protein
MENEKLSFRNFTIRFGIKFFSDMQYSNNQWRNEDIEETIFSGKNKDYFLNLKETWKFKYTSLFWVLLLFFSIIVHYLVSIFLSLFLLLLLNIVYRQGVIHLLLIEIEYWWIHYQWFSFFEIPDVYLHHFCEPFVVISLIHLLLAILKPNSWSLCRIWSWLSTFYQL